MSTAENRLELSNKNSFNRSKHKGSNLTWFVGKVSVKTRCPDNLKSNRWPSAS